MNFNHYFLVFNEHLTPLAAASVASPAHGYFAMGDAG